MLMHVQEEQEGRIDNELAVVLSSIAVACKQIASMVNRAGISNLTGLAGEQNISGEDQKKLDIVSNEVFSNCLRASGRTVGATACCSAAFSLSHNLATCWGYQLLSQQGATAAFADLGTLQKLVGVVPCCSLTTTPIHQHFGPFELVCSNKVAKIMPTQSCFSVLMYLEVECSMALQQSGKTVYSVWRTVTIQLEPVFAASDMHSVRHYINFCTERTLS